MMRPVSGTHVLFCSENFLPVRHEHRYPPIVLWQMLPEGHDDISLHSL
jgi:hypothetical protein